MIVAANLCFEPVVGTLIRRELGTRAAAASGDTVTPVLARAATPGVGVGPGVDGRPGALPGRRRGARAHNRGWSLTAGWTTGPGRA